MVKTLLQNFINQEKCPSELYKNTTDSVSAIANCSLHYFSSIHAGLMVKTRIPQIVSVQLLIVLYISSVQYMLV